jgi:predicted transcriptional regulator
MTTTKTADATKKDETHSLMSIRLTVEERDILEAYARAQERSMNWVVRKALNDFLKEQGL